MKKSQKTLLLILVVSILGTIGYSAWKHSTGRTSNVSGRKVLFYQDSMHPWVKSDQPGKCTICAMELTAIYEGEKEFGAGENVVALRSNSITVLNVQAEEVRRRPLSRALRVAGTLEANETRRTIVSAPAPCRIQTLAVAYAGVEVEKGQTLMTLFSPELVQKRAYYFAVGIAPESLGNATLQATNAYPYAVVLTAPQSGTVVERPVSVGQYVPEGEKLLTIVDSSILWFRFDVYERQLPWFKPGQTLEVTVESVPDKVFAAVVSFIEPTLNDATRSVKVRAEVPNPILDMNGHAQRLLRFGMYAEGRVCSESHSVVAVPRSAILFPGGMAYAYVDLGNGAYERRHVTLGRQGDDLWEVRQGLEEGDRVVTSGNVLIDAQAQFNQGSKPDSTGADEMAAAKPPVGPAHAAGMMEHSTAGAAAPETMASSATLNPAAQKALTDFLAIADGISQALAADSLDQLKQHTARLPKAATSLVKEAGSSPGWRAVLQRLEASAQWPATADLAAARKTFLPFSTNVVELVQLLRGQEEMFRSLKVYHCPMAPKPGLWFQAKGPLRNPFYGAEMLTCGNEVPRSKVAATALAAPAQECKAPPASVAHEMHEATEAASRPHAEHVPAARPMGTNLTVSGPAPSLASPDRTLASTNAHQGRSEVTHDRPALNEQSWNMLFADNSQSPAATAAGVTAHRRHLRIATLAEAYAAQAAEAAAQSDARSASASATNGLTAAQQQVLRTLADVADGMGQALAADSVPRFNDQATLLPAVFTGLRREFDADHPLTGLIRKVMEERTPLAGAGQGKTAKTLDGAREVFLPFSTAVVELVKKLRKENQAFATLKVYHCPMAPKPGLWIQAKAPLANPFFGSKMLRCGEEVKP